MPNLETLKTISEIANHFLTIIALLVGGLWTYYHFIKGRLYKERLEPKVGGQFFQYDNWLNLLVCYQLKNVGLSKVQIKHEGSALEIFSCDRLKYNPNHESIEWQDLTTLSIFDKHEWVEPGEIIEEQELINVVNNDIIAIKISMKVVSCKNLEWNVAIFVPMKTS